MDQELTSPTVISFLIHVQCLAQSCDWDADHF